MAAIKGRDQPGPSHPRLGLTTNPAPDPASDATGRDTGQKQARPAATGDTGRWTIPTSSQNSSPTLRELFQRRNPCPGHELGTQARWDSGWEKGLPHSRQWSYLLSRDLQSTGPTQNSELTINGVSGVPLSPRISFPLPCQFGNLTLILISHNASVPHGAPRERFVIQIRGLYYDTPSQCSLCYICRWHLDHPCPLLLIFPWTYLP